jgi:hypothetical protein
VGPGEPLRSGRDFALISKQKIIAMTKLALYDKNEGEEDRRANEFFRHDYIYKKNAVTRMCVGAGAAVLIGLYWLRMFFIDGVDLFGLDLNVYFREAALFMLAVLAVYSVIGTIQGSRQYYLIQKRLKRYSALLHQVERINERARRQADEEGAADLVYGADINRKGSRR